MLKHAHRASRSMRLGLTFLWRTDAILTDLVSLKGFGSRPYAADAAREQAAPAGYPHHRARVLDGRAVAAQWQAELAQEVADMKAKGLRRPGLGVVLVGNRPDSQLYVARKQEACSRVGIHSELCHLPASATQEDVQNAITGLCRDSRIDGILVQLPLPRHIDEEAIIESFDPSKDVDGFHPLNIGRILMRGRSAHFVPCTALGCTQLLERSGIDMKDKSVVVMGDSNIVGMPLAMLFRDSGAATVTVIHRTSYRELFQDSYNHERALQRAKAAACLPRLPGLLSRQAPQQQQQQQQQQESSPQQHQQQPPSPAEGRNGSGADQQAHRPYKVSYASQMRDAYSGGSGNDGSRRIRQHDADFRRRHSPPYDTQQPHEQHQGQAFSRADSGGFPGGSDVRHQQQPQPSRRGLGMHLEDLPGITRTADILVVAVGYPQLVGPDWLKPGAVVIDVGINVVDSKDEWHRHQCPDECGLRPVAQASNPLPLQQQQQQQQQQQHLSQQQQEQQCGPGAAAAGFHVVGDVDFCGVAEVASAVTPVPGGVGPMTIAALMFNTVLAAKFAQGAIE